MSCVFIGGIVLCHVFLLVAFLYRDHYFTRVTWQDDDHVMVVWTNRVQNVSLICICTMTPLYCEKSHVQTTVGGWTVVVSTSITLSTTAFSICSNPQSDLCVFITKPIYQDK